MRRNLPKYFKLPDNFKEAAENYFNSLDNPSFEKVIRDLIEKYGVENTSKNFEVNAKVYEELKGISEQEKQQIHDKYFNNSEIYENEVRKILNQLDLDKTTEVVSNAKDENINREINLRKKKTSLSLLEMFMLWSLSFSFSSLLAYFVSDINGVIGVFIFWILIGIVYLFSFLNKKNK